EFGPDGRLQPLQHTADRVRHLIESDGGVDFLVIAEGAQGRHEQPQVARSLDRQAQVELERGDLVGDQYQRQTAATRAGGVSAAHVEHVVVEAVPDLPQPRRAGDRLDCRYECGVLDVVLLTTQDADVRADGGHAGGPAVELG